MNIEKFHGNLEQNKRFNIKYNSHIPTKHKWYAVVNGNYLGITEGEYIISDSDNTLITTLVDIPNYLRPHLKFSDHE